MDGDPALRRRGSSRAAATWAGDGTAPPPTDEATGSPSGPPGRVKDELAAPGVYTGGSKSLPPPDTSVSWQLCLGLLLFRLANAAAVRTFFNPDEYWQSLEVAHKMVFGYGHETWEWREGIRGYFHPLIFAALYRALAAAGWDSPALIRLSPRLLQGAFAAVGDVYLFRLAARELGSRRAACWALACNLGSWFMFFCITRTFSSSLEAVLTVVALYYWPGPGGLPPGGPSRSRQLALSLSAVACVVRPTSAITWLYVGLLTFWEAADRWRFLLAEVVPIGAAALAGSSLLDRHVSGRWGLAPLGFVRFNVLGSGASLYGTHAWHWYFMHGFPAMLATLAPLAAYGAWAAGGRRRLAWLVAWTLGAYSLAGHKEFRFVLPMLPLALAYAGYALFLLDARCCRQLSPSRQQGRGPAGPAPGAAHPAAPPPGGPSGGGDGRHGRQCRRRGMFWAGVAALLLTQAAPALYFSLVHQRGSVAVMTFLADEAGGGVAAGGGGAPPSFLFLMPCHSTPYYSHIHRHVDMRFLDCSPRRKGPESTESWRFLSSPLATAREAMAAVQRDAGGSAAPTHVIVFDTHAEALRPLFLERGFRQVRSFRHAHFPVDGELQSEVLVYKREAGAQATDAHGSDSVTEGRSRAGGAQI